MVMHVSGRAWESACRQRPSNEVFESRWMVWQRGEGGDRHEQRQGKETAGEENNRGVERRTLRGDYWCVDDHIMRTATCLARCELDTVRHWPLQALASCVQMQTWSGPPCLSAARRTLRQDGLVAPARLL